MTRSSILLIGVLLLQGCVATSSSKLNTNSVATFKPGVTTISDAESALGQPYQDNKLPDGSRVLQYVSKVHQVAGDGMPTTGTELPKYNEKNVSLILAFNAKGRFVHAWSNSKDRNNAWPSDLSHVTNGDIEWNGAGLNLRPGG